jgi:crotonobetainyl-CoA:carnitine CoA-transferase CaiB-like acyl-CoA transferase
MTLGDLGADVIKVERPGAGDETRGWGSGPAGQSAYFTSINRNKLSVAADLNDPADRALILDLAAGADVVVDNFLVGMLEKRGIDPTALVEKHPRLVWCSITGFGLGNPRPGYDFVTQAECGWMAITGEPDGEPMKVGVALADDESLRSYAGRLEHRERVASEIGAAVRTRPAAYWLERLDAAGVPAGVVKSVLQALSDANASPIMGMPSSVGGRWRLEPPALDAHGPVVRRSGWGVFASL